MVGCLYLGDVQAWRTVVSAGLSLRLPTVQLPCSLQRATSLLWASVTSSVAFIHSTSRYGTLGDSRRLGMGKRWYSLRASPFLVPAKVSHTDGWTPADAAGRLMKLEEMGRGRSWSLVTGLRQGLGVPVLLSRHSSCV